MEQYEQIRRRVLVDGLSQRQAARELGHARKTVRKAIELSTPPPYTRKKPLRRPVIEPVQKIIDAWIEIDRSRPRKQRHTAQRIYERLCAEYGFQGSSSAVRRYVAKLKATSGEVFFPLIFDPGEEAQVDWGDAWVIENGVERKYHFFCMRLCNSGASFVYPYERMPQEALQDGHVRALEFFGGVPRRLAYDNMKTAVLTVGRGRKRKLTRAFMELKSHYLFDTRFCNVASGNEKGHVENLVKFMQRTMLTPLPEVTSREDLAELLLAACRKDLERAKAPSGKSRGELLLEELPSMLPLPPQAFEACIRSSTFASKQALLRFDRNDYSVPVRWAHHPCTIKGFVDHVEIHANDQLVASHSRSYERGVFILEPAHYLPLLEKKPGGLHNGRPFKGEPWGEPFAHMRRELEYRYGDEGTRKFVQVLLLFSDFDEAEVKEAVATCVRQRAFSDDAVRNTLSYRPPRRLGHLDLSTRPELACVGSVTPPASLYDALYAQGGCS